MNSLISAFELFFRDNDLEIKKKLLEAKREVKNFTQFRYYLNLKKILIN